MHGQWQIARAGTDFSSWIYVLGVDTHLLLSTRRPSFETAGATTYSRVLASGGEGSVRRHSFTDSKTYPVPRTPRPSLPLPELHPLRSLA
jgi:hypothetical protein